MKKLRLWVPPAIFWMLLCAALWPLLLYDSNKPNPAKPKVHAQGDIGAPKVSTAAFELPTALPYRDEIAEISQRPLFSENRRIPSPETIESSPEIEQAQPAIEETVVVEAPPPPPEPPDLAFKGFMQSGENVRALVNILASKEEKWVTVGDTILEWRVGEISANFILLEHDDIEHIVEISR